eukprot:Rmarinus@m.24562
MKLYTYPDNPRAHKALIAAEYNGVKIELPEFTFGVTNKTDEFLRWNPHGKVPTFVTDDGVGIFESNAIARYVARIRNDTQLFGRSFSEHGQVDSWIDFESTLATSGGAWFYPYMGYIPFNQKAIDSAKADVAKMLGVLDSHLLTRTYFVGERVTLADIILFCDLAFLYKKIATADFRKSFTNLNRWFNTMLNQPQVKAVIGEFKYCESTPTPVKQAAAGKKEEKKPKKAEPKAEKKEKKAEKKKEETPEEPEEPKPEKAKKSELESLPPTPMDLNHFKRVYSNEETRESALPKFFDMYDKDGYSIWYCEYKHSDENTGPHFLCSNLIGGWFQRLDRLRKWGFGNVLVTDTPGESFHRISGVWLFRGPNVPDVMTECDDCELYDWRKMDITNPADKELLEDYWAWDGKLQGRTYVDGKTFK